MTGTSPAITSLVTCQFAVGGLFDSAPIDYEIHLVRRHKWGSPGPTLCDVDRFGPGAPGWSLGGGVDGPGMVHKPCRGCVEVANRDFPGLPISGMAALSRPMMAALATADTGRK